MRFAIVGEDVNTTLPYAQAINQAATELDFSPVAAYAVAWRETIRGERSGLWKDAATVVSGDGGHGLFQLTSWYPSTWQQPYWNAHWAILRWLLPSMMHYEAVHRYAGEALLQACADAFNAGQGAVCSACERGESLDSVTTGHDYGQDVVATYRRLVAGDPPV
jgi:hypothetical protein